LREKFNKFINKYGVLELFYVLLYPFFLPLFMFKSTTLSIINIIKSLMKYEWKYLSGNNQKNAFNNFFYYIQDYNIKKFGRYGKSNLLSGQEYDLKGWFHVTPFSLRMQASFGTVFIMFFAMCFWLLSWIVLFPDNPQVFVILAITVFSTIFFATFIEIQNYNILGWMFFPLFLTSLINADYLMLSIALFMIALSSFTAFFLACIFLCVSFFYMPDIFIFISATPAGIKWAYPVFISFSNDGFGKLFAIIGGHDKVKYTRKSKKKIQVGKVYFFGCMIPFVTYYIYLYSWTIQSTFIFLALLLFIINETKVRFADQQSFYQLILSTFIFSLLTIERIDTGLFFLFILAIYPVYYWVFNVYSPLKHFVSPDIFKPYNTRLCIESISQFFRSIPVGEKVIMAYKNPEGQYANLFNGYRVLNEPIQYAATINGISFFPDWYTVMENNKRNSTEAFWIDTEQKAKDYMGVNSIRYIIVPSFLDTFSEENFIKISEYKFEFENNFMEAANYSITLFEVKGE